MSQTHNFKNIISVGECIIFAMLAVLVVAEVAVAAEKKTQIKSIQTGINTVWCKQNTAAGWLFIREKRWNIEGTFSFFFELKPKKQKQKKEKKALGKIIKLLLKHLLLLLLCANRL